MRALVGRLQPGEFLLQLLRPPAPSFYAEINLLRVGVTRCARDDKTLTRASPRRVGLEGRGGLCLRQQASEARPAR